MGQARALSALGLVVNRTMAVSRGLPEPQANQAWAVQAAQPAQAVQALQAVQVVRARQAVQPA